MVKSGEAWDGGKSDRYEFFGPFGGHELVICDSQRDARRVATYAEDQFSRSYLVFPFGILLLECQ